MSIIPDRLATEAERAVARVALDFAGPAAREVCVGLAISQSRRNPKRTPGPVERIMREVQALTGVVPRDESTATVWVAGTPMEVPDRLLPEVFRSYNRHADSRPVVVTDIDHKAGTMTVEWA